MQGWIMELECGASHVLHGSASPDKSWYKTGSGDPSEDHAAPVPLGVQKKTTLITDSMSDSCSQLSIYSGVSE